MSLVKYIAAAALVGVALAPLGAQAQSVSPGDIEYSYIGGVESVILHNTSGAALTDVTLTETLLNHPDVTDFTAIGTLASGASLSSGTDFLLPFAFGDNPSALYPNDPFSLTVTANGAGPYAASIQQFYNSDGSPAPVAARTPFSPAVPEPGALPLLAAGLALAGLSAARRPRRN